MFNLDDVKFLFMNEGEVNKIEVDGRVIWQKYDDDVIEGEWADFIKTIEDGTYSTYYTVGNIVGEIDLGEEGRIQMQIVGFDCDELADGSNRYAAVSLIGKQLLNTNKRMNPAIAMSCGSYIDGTGAIGGWEHSEVKQYLNGTIEPSIPTTISSRIVNVIKTHRAYDSNGDRFDQTTSERLWLPSYNEIYSASDKYYEAFPNNDSRIKAKSDSTKHNWWTRNAAMKDSFYCINYTGAGSLAMAENAESIALCFSMGFGAPKLTAAQTLAMLTVNTKFDPNLDIGEEISDEEALAIITGGETY